MKKRYTPLLVFAALALLSSSFGKFEKSKQFHASSSAILDTLYPVLPDVPYDYRIHFPAHIINSVGLTTQDTTFINNYYITNHGATLGRVLFYDKKLAVGDNNLSCASCHKQAHGFADNKAFSLGINATPTVRNSPSLYGLGWQQGDLEIWENALFWDCQIMPLDEMVLKPIVHEGELGKDLQVLVDKLTNTEYYPQLFEKAFGDPAITPERIGNALAQFVRSMSSFESPFDKFFATQDTNSLSVSEKRGKQIFYSSCTSSCHAPPQFNSTKPHCNGLDPETTDPGLGGWTHQPKDSAKFRSPSLRNIALSAPYMHDGRFQTLEEVIDFYSEGLQPHPNSSFHAYYFTIQGFEFTAQEKADLLAFLKTLTDPVLTTHVKWSNPFNAALADHFLPLEERVRIFPNPFRQQAIVEWENPTGKTYSLRLTTLEGRVLKTYQTAEAQFVLEENALTPGVYLLEIMQGNRKKVERLVVQ